MTAHPIDTEALRRLAGAATPGPWPLLSGGEYVGGVGLLVAPDDGGVSPANAAFIAAARTAIPALLDALAAAEDRATRAEARAEALRINLDYWQIRARDMNDERDNWEQIALDEREGARDLLEQVNVRDVRIRAWEQQYTQDTDSLTREIDEAERVHRDLTSSLGFGDGITEPMADNKTIIQHVGEAVANAQELWELTQAACVEADCDPEEDCYDHHPVRRAERAEARIQAVREVLDRAEQRHDNAVLFNGANFPAICSAPDIRQALDGDT